MRSIVGRLEVGRSYATATVVALLALGSLLLPAGSALAARGHVLEGSFGSEGTGSGQFEGPTAMAASEATGDVYVVDGGANRVEWFSAGGEFLGQFDGSGSFEVEGVVEAGEPAPTGKLSEVDGIAVDNSCALHLPHPLTGEACEASDPSAGDVYVADAGHQAIDKFGANGAYIGQITGLGPVGGVAVDAEGKVWVYLDAAGGSVDSFSNAVTNVLVATHSSSFSGIGFSSSGIAVDSNADLYLRYLSIEQEPSLHVIAKFDSEGNVLSRLLDSEESSAVAVEALTEDVYVDNLGSVARFAPDESLLERFSAPGLSGSEGVTVDERTETVYVTDTAADKVDVFGPEAPSAPTTGAVSVTNVSAAGATLEADVDPHGDATGYHFEYGPCATATTCVAPVPDGVLHGDFEVHHVRLHVQDLLAGTDSSFRLIAHNSFDASEPVESKQGSFRTAPAPSNGLLPDGRHWEMVSPTNKNGALLMSLDAPLASSGGIIQAAAAGGSVTYLANAPIEGGPEGNANLTQVLATRGPGGWQSKGIAIPHDTVTTQSVGQGEEYRFFSEDLALSIVQPFGGFVPASSPFSLSPGEASEQTAFLRTDLLEGGGLCSPRSAHCFTPLVTGCPAEGEPCPPGVEEHANVPAGTIFGQIAEHDPSVQPCPPGLLCGPQFVSATPDLAHVLLESSTQLTPTPTAGIGLYEWTHGALALVSVLPEEEGGAAAEGPVLGGGTSTADDARNAISLDGSRVFFSNSAHGLYVRDTQAGRTARIDVPEPACVPESECGGSGASPEAEFQAATPDGGRVFFTDVQRLTAGSGAAPRRPDLYECELQEGEEGLECSLTDLTPLAAGEESAAVRGSIAGISEDGSWVYFVANGVLAAGATPGNCQTRALSSPPHAVCNLYASHEGATTLIARLSAEDSPDWANGSSLLPELTAGVSPSGHWLSFMSNGQLTSYDNRDAASGKPDEEVYLYEGLSEQLVCASCDPTGARPTGERNLRSSALVGKEMWERSSWLAASIPGWTAIRLGTARYQPRYLDDDGRLFFDSDSALVSQDVNGSWDVYEYEPPGVPAGANACTPSSSAFSERSHGCVALISSGSATGESAFLDASQGGGDVFFLTGEQLAKQDSDTSLDVYDAHECGVGSACPIEGPVQPPPCGAADSCKPSPGPLPAVFGSLPTSTFDGVGNLAPAPKGPSHTGPSRAEKLEKALKACKKKPKAKRKACERQARKRFGAAKHARKSGRTK